MFTIASVPSVPLAAIVVQVAECEAVAICRV
jgi:hypothetical protein